MDKAKILIVEDEVIVAMDVERRLVKLGYNVTNSVSSGEEAINKVAEDQPDLVLMDIYLKGTIDGIEAAKQIYNRFNIPVIYLTANADNHTLERAKTTEPLGYLLKPFKERELQATIEITLSRHRTERKLKENEQWLTTVLKSIGDAVIASNVKGAVTFMNPVAEALTGWQQEDAFGKDSTEVFNIADEETHTLVESPIKQALQQGVAVGLPAQTILISRNGVEIPIDDSVAPIKDDKGNITGAVLVFRDITERKQVEEAYQKQTEQLQLIAELEKLNQLKDDFLSTVSHELRTPMSNMKMAIQMLKISPSAIRNQRYLEILQAECAREIELINNILDLQRLEATSYPIFYTEAVFLQEWLPAIVEPFRGRIQERQQTLQINLSPNFPPIVSDRASLERMLIELLNNACKYTPAGGKIVIGIHQDGDGEESSALVQVQSCLLPTGQQLFTSTSSTIFTVSNSAEIPAAELPRIFEKFYRIPKADPWKQGGTGLGLALVQKLVEHLQGTIQVESSDGWTTFTVRLFQSLSGTKE